MDDTEVIAALAALAQSTRLQTFRVLVAREPEGVPAGELARLIEVPQKTMTAHLAILARVKLIGGERQSRSIIYRANLRRIRDGFRLYGLRSRGRRDVPRLAGSADH